MMLASNSHPQYSSRLNVLNDQSLNFNQAISSSNPNVYIYSGNSYSLSLKAEQITVEHLSKFRQLRINVTGTLIKPNNTCCFWITAITGGMVLFPLFFICCDWWKRIVNKIYDVELSSYEAINKFIHNSRAEQIYVTVQDNKLNQQKIEKILSALERRQVKNFVFNNVAMGFNFQNNNYSNFNKNWQRIKNFGIRHDISWANQFVNTQL